MNYRDFTIPYNRNYLLLAFKLGLFGLLGSILVGTGEFMVHYSTQELTGDFPFSFFNGIPRSNLIIGSFLMSLSIPLYVLGYMHVYLALRTGNQFWAGVVFLLGLASFTIGGIWAGSRGFLGLIINNYTPYDFQDPFNKIMEDYVLVLESLVNVLRVLMLLLSLILIYTILKYKTLYPRWFALFNPIFILLLIFLLFFLAPKIGYPIVTSAMNISHFIFFGTSLIIIYNQLKQFK